MGTSSPSDQELDRALASTKETVKKKKKQARWPGYLEKSRPLRTYAEMIGPSTARTELGEIYQLETWQATRDFLSEQNSVLFSTDLVHCLHMGAGNDDRARINATKNGHISSISVRFQDGRIRSVVSAHTWELGGEPGLLPRLRLLMTHCAVGDRTTPSQLGIAIMRETWQMEKLPWHWAPSRQVQKTLRRESCPPRTESPGVLDNREWPEAYEYDLSNAFASHFNVLPAGRVITVSHLCGDWRHSDATWFRLCRIHLPDSIIAPLPKKRDDNLWSWPRQGTWEGWLWKEQADSAVEIGATIEPGPGWAWLRMTEDTATWCKRVIALKNSAPAEIVGMVKQSIVAAIGFHALGSESYQVHDYMTPGQSRPLFDPHGGKPFSDLYLTTVANDRGSMIHWQRYSIMKTNQTLYDMARQFTGPEILHINFDSIVSTKPVEAGHQWKTSKLTRVRLPYARALIADQKVRLPGIPKYAPGAESSPGTGHGEG